MREKLKDINGIRQSFVATFERYGKKKVYQGIELTTLLFTNVRNNKGEQYCDHIWFTETKGFKQWKFEPGDSVSFHARVKLYIKGYRGSRELDEYKPVSKDYKLSHPNNIVAIKGSNSRQGSLF